MLKADDLHRKAALLSNTLADFADEDVPGRKAVVDQILEVREQWKDVRYEIETNQQRRKLPQPKPTSTTTGLTDSEIKVELQRIRVNISKMKDKLEERPDHKKASEWLADLDRLIGLREAYEAELTDRKYATDSGNSGKNEEG